MKFPSMLSYDERRLLYWLTREYYQGAGHIVDGGCFLGGSTVALAAGLRDGGHPDADGKVHAYDQFVLNQYMIDHYLQDRPGLKPGDSFRPLFDELTRPYRRYLQVNEGDIIHLGWGGEPIEVLFLDVLKNWPINDSVLRNFFPHLIPGRSVVVQQDYVHEWCPWIHISMELLADYFDYLDFTPFSSAVYLLTKEIPPALLQLSVEHDLSAGAKMRLMHRAVQRFSGEARGAVETAEARLLLTLLGPEMARERLVQIKERYAHSEHIQFVANNVLRYIERGNRN
jgi:hypothetical protein